MRLGRRAKWISAGVVGAVVASAFSIAPIVRWRAKVAAEKRGFELEVESVSAGWSQIELRGVVARLKGTSVRVRLDGANVRFSGFGTVDQVEAHGGEIGVVGGPGDVEEQVRAWRSRRGGTGAGAQPAESKILRADGLKIVWLASRGGAVFAGAEGVSVTRDGDGIAVACAVAHAKDHGVAVDVTEGEARIDRAGQLVSAGAGAVAITFERVIEVAKDDTRVDPSKSSELVPPPLPPTNATSRGHGKSAPPQAIEQTAHLELPRLAKARAAVGAIASLARERIADGATVKIDAVSVHLRQGNDLIDVGPGPLLVERKGDALTSTFHTNESAGGTPLGWTASLPLAAGDAEVSLTGGPISLARLGVAEGQAGLTDVERATIAGKGRVVLAATGDELTFDLDFDVRGLAFRSERLAVDVVRGVDSSFLARGTLSDAGDLRLDDVEVALGAMRAIVHGDAHGSHETKDLTASLAIDVPATSCESMLASVPSALLPALEGAQMEGAFGLRARLGFDTRDLDALALDVDVKDGCKLAEVPEELAKDRFTKPFDHAVYAPDGTIAVLSTGPTSEAWTDLAHISPFMQVAVLTTEDGGFYRHHGFNRYAIRNALVANLKAGRFARGASTITMQLAKNLFLSREKTLSRKLEEVVLADYLEQVFSKEEMMELYLNIIEFGPNVYGIKAAAKRYFGRPPAELNLAECLFLSSLLPSPLRYSKLAEKPKLSEGWMKHVQALMQIAEKNGLVSQAELAIAMTEEVEFVTDEKAPPPPPRVPVRGTQFEQTREGDPDAWHEL